MDWMPKAGWNTGARPVQIDKRADTAKALWDSALQEGVDTMEAAGKACFGRDWIMPMSEALGIGRASLHRWLSKERPLTMDHPVWLDVVRVLEERQGALEGQAKAVKEMRAKLKAALRQADTFESGRHAGGTS